MYLYKHVHTGLNNVHTCLYIKMYVHVYTWMYIPCIYMFIDFQNCIYMYIHFIKCIYMSEQCKWCVCTIVWTMYMMRMYYSIVHTHHIHCSDMYIHVYARWVGLQMLDTRSPSPTYPIPLAKHLNHAAVNQQWLELECHGLMLKPEMFKKLKA